MAFGRTNTAAQQPQPEAWRARGFLNFYLPRKNGSDGKLGAISLKLSSEDEVKICEWLEADEKNLEKLMAKIKVVYRSAEKAEGSGFDI